MNLVQISQPPVTPLTNSEIVRKWRHSLQKIFLGRTKEPGSCTLGVGRLVPPRPLFTDYIQLWDPADKIFKKLETFDGMTIEILQASPSLQVSNRFLLI